MKTRRPLDEQPPTSTRPRAVAPSVAEFDILDLYGPVGDYVRLWAPHTEASPIAIYASALAALGALIGRGPSWRFGNEPHHARLFVLLIGPTGAGRKGTALNVGVTQLLAAVDEDFARTRTVSGLSSAEGLIVEVRDPTPSTLNGEGRTLAQADKGSVDKRLLVVEGEMAGPLEAMARDGNRLSAILRDAWDGKNLRTLVKRDPQSATGPHIAIVGAITAFELKELLKGKSVRNGLANRFLAVWSTRARLCRRIPNPIQSHPKRSSAALNRPSDARATSRRSGGAARRNSRGNSRTRSDWPS